VALPLQRESAHENQKARKPFGFGDGQLKHSVPAFREGRPW
jgi:hypothetical protein